MLPVALICAADDNSTLYFNAILYVQGIKRFAKVHQRITAEELSEVGKLRQHDAERARGEMSSSSEKALADKAADKSLTVADQEQEKSTVDEAAEEDDEVEQLTGPRVKPAAGEQAAEINIGPRSLRKRKAKEDNEKEKEADKEEPDSKKQRTDKKKKKKKVSMDSDNKSPDYIWPDIAC